MRCINTEQDQPNSLAAEKASVVPKAFELGRGININHTLQLKKNLEGVGA